MVCDLGTCLYEGLGLYIVMEGFLGVDSGSGSHLMEEVLMLWKSSAAEVIVTPNSDTPYSFAWLDLRVEPVVIQVPAMERPGVQKIV